VVRHVRRPWTNDDTGVRLYVIHFELWLYPTKVTHHITTVSVYCGTLSIPYYWRRLHIV